MEITQEQANELVKEMTDQEIAEQKADEAERQEEFCN